MTSTVLVERVVIRNYKSIAQCDVALRALTFLIGPNGAGKSNFLDAMRFVTDSLRTSLEHALRDRGGIKEVRRRSEGHPTHFGIRLEFALPDGRKGHYAFRIGARQRGQYEVQSEECSLGPAVYQVQSGKVRSSVPVLPPATSDRLYLVNAAGLPEFRPVYDALSRMGFYNLNPDVMRALQPPDPAPILARDGRNLASVLDRMTQADPRLKGRIEEYLAKVVPGVEAVNAKFVEHMATVEFKQRVQGAQHPWGFLGLHMSDGTLRTLGVLVALFQADDHGPIPLVGIEEPEVALHPAASGILLGGLRDASTRTQVVVTSHSPELVDDDDIDTDSLLAVVSQDGTTCIARVDEPSRTALRDHLYTAGEMLRLNQLGPDPDALESARNGQLKLFDDRGLE